MFCKLKDGVKLAYRYAGPQVNISALDNANEVSIPRAIFDKYFDKLDSEMCFEDVVSQLDGNYIAKRKSWENQYICCVDSTVYKIRTDKHYTDYSLITSVEYFSYTYDDCNADDWEISTCCTNMWTFNSDTKILLAVPVQTNQIMWITAAQQTARVISALYIKLNAFSNYSCRNVAMWHKEEFVITDTDAKILASGPALNKVVLECVRLAIVEMGKTWIPRASNKEVEQHINQTPHKKNTACCISFDVPD